MEISDVTGRVLLLFYYTSCFICGRGRPLLKMFILDFRNLLENPVNNSHFSALVWDLVYTYPLLLCPYCVQGGWTDLTRLYSNWRLHTAYGFDCTCLLYFNAWWRGNLAVAVAVAAKTDTAFDTFYYIYCFTVSVNYSMDWLKSKTKMPFTSNQLLTKFGEIIRNGT